jgi:hypothetical protein
MIHKEFEKDMLARGFPCFEYAAFCKVVKTHFPKVSQAVPEGMFHCTQCLELQEKLKKVRGIGDKTEIEKVQVEIQTHRKIVAMERAEYKTHQLMSRKNPDQYLTIIIDGMDQSKCIIPNYGKERGDKLEKMFLYGPKAHLTGVRDHNGKVWCYWTYDQIPKDGSLVINCLLLTLLDIFNERGSLPEALFLQLDNTKKENKNWMVMGLLSKLLLTVFGKPIQVNFLPVGHTHEDIDQFFSLVAKKLIIARPRSLPHLMAAVGTINTNQNNDKPKQKFLDSYLDLRHFIAGELPDGKDRLKGLDEAHDIRLSYSPKYPGKDNYGPPTPWPLIQTKFASQVKDSEDRTHAYAPTAGARLYKEGVRQYDPALPDADKISAIASACRLGPLRPAYCSSSAMLSGEGERDEPEANKDKFRTQLQAFRNWLEVSN